MTSAWPDLTNVIGIPSPSDFGVRIANRPSVFDEDHKLDFDMTIGQNAITIQTLAWSSEFGVLHIYVHNTDQTQNYTRANPN